MSCIVTREYLISILKAQKEDKITANDVICTASWIQGGIEVLDWEDNESLSVTSEVVDDLDSLAIILITKDDIEAYIEFLKTPIGEFEKGSRKLWEYNTTINREERKKNLKDIVPYSSIHGEHLPHNNEKSSIQQLQGAGALQGSLELAWQL